MEPAVNDTAKSEEVPRAMEISRVPEVKVGNVYANALCQCERCVKIRTGNASLLLLEM